MQVPSRNGALTALACLFTAAFAAQPLLAAAQTSPGKVLLWRQKTGMIDGVNLPAGSAIFSIHDDGSHLRQLTPWKKGVFDIPSPGMWPVNAFSPSGRFSVFVREHSDLAYPDPAIRGKYVMIDSRGERVRTLFPGHDDLQPPRDGPGYGSVTWGPAGTNEIAFANAPDTRPHKHPACVRLMHPNGTDNHKLWCAPRWDYRAIEAIRWSGDGRRLLVYAVQSTISKHRADLYMIDTGTGAATLIEPDVDSPHNLGSIGDLSYDGHEVVYQVAWNSPHPNPCSAAVSANVPFVWCARNMTTGQVTPLVDPDNAVREWISDAAISPDGSQVVVEGGTNTTSDLELYVFNTDGTGLRQITTPCLDNYHGGAMYWEPVRFSPDGTQVLANCRFDAYQYPPPPGTSEHKIYLVNPADGSARFVAYGTAYDWHVPSI